MITPVFVRIYALNDGMLCIRPDQITHVKFPYEGRDAGLVVIYLAGHDYTIPQEEWGRLYPFMKILHTKPEINRFLGIEPDPDVPF